MASRILGVKTEVVDWEGLLRRTIQRAGACQDPRLSHLQRALTAGTAQKVLRQYGIIREADLEREFPPSRK